ncbi:hypothetical protein [Actinoplanes sp. N902-109]|uniref:hypothetical protein n=1 Tax=Actinoplanes sp. (strain N902-109) TaxID=649831 RepID=UPI00032948D3|nr:hypothetical protein [Actinoplanes sp. N902-109]AGL21293.1 oxidoreductase domain-containing protein [Actinoplanes sp. N902-109]
MAPTEAEATLITEAALRNDIMLLTKSCHDIDWLVHLFGQTPAQISSFGSLSHFRAADRPAEAADRCVACPLKQTCPYSAAPPARSR